MPDARTCPDCGSLLPLRAPEGLCPRCLLRAGLGGDALALDRAGAVAATVELAAEARSGGVLATIAATLGAVPGILLRDTDLGPEAPLVRPGAGSGADDSVRYRIDGEIARGGMGTVLRDATQTSAATSPSRCFTTACAAIPTWSAGSSRRRRSAASSSIRGSCPSTSSASLPTVARSSR